MSSTVKENIIPSNEAERIKALRRYNILDTPPDGSFDRLTYLASQLFGVPIAIVSLVDEDRIWFKSKQGLDVDRLDRDPGLCASAILSDDIYLVEDARKDPRALANPLVAGEFGLQFYVASPLRTKDGYNLGTFCLIDKNKRTFSDSQKAILKTLADIVMDEIELRLSAINAIRSQKEMLGIFAHDLKAPPRKISVLADFIKEDKNNGDAVDKMCEQIKDVAKGMNDIIAQLLESARLEAENITLKLEKVNFKEAIKKAVKANQVLADKKGQKLHFNAKATPFVYADKGKMIEIVDNLVNNAIKYSPKEKNIYITLNEENSRAILSVKDEGPGLTAQDMEGLFNRFTRSSAKPTGGESSTGLGLWIVRMLVEAHHGITWAESEGKGKGAEFFVEIPVAS